MPIFEALSDKLTAVIDIGSAYTKFGFSGEFSPRCIIKSEIRCKKTGTLRKVYDYKDEHDLYDLLVDFLHILYFKYALFSPKDRPVVIVESLLSPTVFRETLAKVLFMHYEISVMLVLPSHLVSLAPLALETGLVVDVGYSEAVAIPICHGLPIIHAWQALPIASELIHSNLRTLLINDRNSGIEALSDAIIEDIKVRCCFVTKIGRVETLSNKKSDLSPAPEVLYPIRGQETIKVSGKTREFAYELLYEEDKDCLCLSTMILDAILKTDLHLRNQLAGNIVLIGGTTMATGFKARLRDELVKQMKNPRYGKLKVDGFKFHSLPAKENYNSWLGGVIYGATDLLSMKGVNRESYLKEKRLPDWANLRDNNRTL